MNPAQFLQTLTRPELARLCAEWNGFEKQDEYIKLVSEWVDEHCPANDTFRFIVIEITARDLLLKFMAARMKFDLRTISAETFKNLTSDPYALGLTGNKQ